MATGVFIASIKSNHFDYDKEGPWSGYSPDGILGNRLNGWDNGKLFHTICKMEDAKQFDWGCWGIKWEKKKIIAFLNQEEYKKNEIAKNLLLTANTLEEDTDYLLVALED